MLLWLPLVTIYYLVPLGTLGVSLGNSSNFHTLTHITPQHAPTYTNIHWYCMVIQFQTHTMADPAEDPPRDPDRPVPAPRAIQLTVKYPTFNWEGNTHEQFKTFKQRTEILMEGPYEDYKEPDKVAAILGWLGDKGHQVYASLDWVALGKNKKLYKHVLEAFESYFKPMQTIMHSWYQLGNIYSSQCKDQTEFMTRLKELSKETGFKEPDELTKFLFVIHNTDSKVREYLIDKGDPTKTCTEFLAMARSVESMVKTETLSRELLGQVGKVPISSIDRGRGRGRGSRGRSHSRTPRASTPGAKQCGRCGKKHPPRKCPAYNQTCKRCKIKGHFQQYCKTKNPGGAHPPRGSRREQYEVTKYSEQPPNYGSDYEFCEDSIHFVFKKGSKEPSSNNIMFDEISNTQVLGMLS